MSQRYPGGVITKSPTAPTQTAASGVWTLEQVAENVKNATWPPNGPYYVEDVFSTYLYTGNGSTQTITNGIDLSGKGGLVWIKTRNDSYENKLTDTARGVQLSLSSNTTTAQAAEPNGLTAFTSSGFTVGSDGGHNLSSGALISWTFRKQAKFFDVVTFTGPTTGNTITVNHNLGSVPGCIIYRSYDNSDNWYVWHRSLADENYLTLESTSAASDYNHSINATSTTFSLRASYNIAANGGNCIAYLFAHDAGGFGRENDQSIVKCGSYTGTGATGNKINVGFEPQFVLIKCSSSTGNWVLHDSGRGISTSTTPQLAANVSNAESNTSEIELTSEGFELKGSSGDYNAGSATYVYIAIRRPMKTPTDATKVFMPTVYTGTNADNRLINTTINPDFVMIRQRDDTVVPGMYTGARLTGQQFMITGSTAAGSTDADSFDEQFISSLSLGNAWSSQNGVWVGNDATRKFNANTTSNNHIIHAFKRAPGFMDVVCYTGTGVNRTVTHNLGAVPEFMIVRRRNTTGNWLIYTQPTGNAKYLLFDTNQGEQTLSTIWNNTTPTSSVFTVGTENEVNANGSTFIAVLFASVAGVSKIGSYTGNGTSQTINCGFTAGARYVLIKSSSTTADWMVYDTARGIVTGNDPQLRLNSAQAEETGYDGLDPSNSGFIVNHSVNHHVNYNGETYIYLAIA